MSDRIIKFRCWCLDMSKVGYYEYFNLPGDFLNTTIGISRTRIQQIITWEQFTGLHDKNGTDIYEGDIIRYECKNHYQLGDVENIGTVIFSTNKFVVDWTQDPLRMYPDDMVMNGISHHEIIGTIHNKATDK